MPVNGLEILVLALALAFIVFGLLIARLSTASSGVAVALNAATLLSLQETYSADFATYANTAVATVTGMGFAVLVAQLIRSSDAKIGFCRMGFDGFRYLGEIDSDPATVPRMVARLVKRHCDQPM